MSKTNISKNRNHIIKSYMELALREAQQAQQEGEVPVGAVIVDPITGSVIAKAHNQVIQHNNPVHHAEILAITKATQVVNNYRLSNLDMYVTLEPCPMCAGAIIHSRINRLYFGAFDSKGGGVVNQARVLSSEWRYNHRPYYQGGVLEEKSCELLKIFFKNLRK